MGAVLAVALLICAQVETATPAETATVAEGLSLGPSVGTASDAESLDGLDALLADLGEEPLTSAELEILQRLGSGTATVARTATVAWVAPGPVVRPVHRTRRRELEETVARSTREALDAVALPAISFRMARRRVLYEGLLLAPFAEGVLDADVRMFDRVTVSPSASRRDHSAGAAGTIELYGARPEGGIHPEAAIEARSADRSTGVFAGVGGGVDQARARAAIGYDDARALRTPSGSDPSSDSSRAGQRWLASGRAAFFRADDPVRVSIGGDLDRALNTRIVDDDGTVRGVARIDQRALGFARADLGGERWGLSLVGGYQGLRQKLELDEVALFDVSADLFEARLSGFGAPFDWLRLDAGAHLAFGGGEAPQEVSHREIEGYFVATLHFEWLEAEIGLRIAHQQFEDPSRTVSGTRPLPQVALHFPIAGPVGVRAGFETGMTVPGGGLFAPASRFAQPEGTITFEAGPTLRGSTYWADLSAFATWIRWPLDVLPEPSPMVRLVPRVRALGVELDGALSIVSGLDLAFNASLAEAIDRDTGVDAYLLPVLSGLLALRYRFNFQNARIEIHARAATKPFAIVGREPEEGWTLGGERPRAFVRAGITGGLDLGAGFVLDLSCENAIDRRYRLHTSAASGGGIDVRAALSWRY